MNEKPKHLWPLRLCCLLMALFLGLALWLAALDRLLPDERAARDAALSALPERSARFERAVREIAAEVGFAPETALAFYPHERQAGIAEDGAAWMVSLLNGRNRPMPDVSAVKDGETLAEAIFGDPSFEGRRHEARDLGQTAVERAASRYLLPVRSSLLTIADERFGGYIEKLPTVLRWVRRGAWLLAGLAVLIGLLLSLIARRQARGLGYAAAGLAGGGLGGAALLIPLRALDVPGLLSEVSASFGAEIRTLLTARLLPIAVICAALFFAGLITVLLVGRKAAHGA